MAAIVIEHLLREYMHGPGSTSGRIGIAFFYCDYRKHETQNAVSLLSSLLKQLCANNSIIPESVKALYEQHFRHGTRPSFDEISESLQSVLQTHSEVIIVIDALDECKNSDGTRASILAEIRKLQTHSKTKLMITSRGIPELAQEFLNDVKLEVRASDADLDRYLDDQLTFRLSKCIRQNDGLRQKVKSEIIESAKGM